MQRRFRVPGDLPRAVLPFANAPNNAVGAALTAALLHSTVLPPGPGAYDRSLTVRTAVLRSDTLPEPESWLPLLLPGEKLFRGALLSRAGKHAEAIKELADEKTPLACLFRALAELGRGDRDAARRALDEALKQLPPERLDFAGLLEHTPLPWPDRVEVNALRAEIEALLKPQP